LLVKEHVDPSDKEKKFFAFVCFEKEEDAKKFFESAKEDDPTNPFPSLYCNWAEKKYARMKKLK